MLPISPQLPRCSSETTAPREQGASRQRISGSDHCALFCLAHYPQPQQAPVPAVQHGLPARAMTGHEAAEACCVVCGCMCLCVPRDEQQREGSASDAVIKAHCFLLPQSYTSAGSSRASTHQLGVAVCACCSRVSRTAVDYCQASAVVLVGK